MEACPNCGSHNLKWYSATEVADGVPQGRLCSHDVHPIFCQACEDCSETIRQIDGDQVADILNKSVDVTLSVLASFYQLLMDDTMKGCVMVLEDYLREIDPEALEALQSKFLPF